MAVCRICPMSCGADRSKDFGVCRMGEEITISKYQLHFGEEPVISGEKGSGTVFFTGCNLNCCFCQNYIISSKNSGKEISVDNLSDIFLKLRDMGAHNINLVTPTHFTLKIIKALDKVKHKLDIPVIWNTGGYEKAETIRLLKGYADIFLTDFKYFDNSYATMYSMAPGYSKFAADALFEMHKITGKYVMKNDILRSGVIVRHMVLPTLSEDSINVLKLVAKTVPPKDILLSLMSQYTPCYKAENHPEINRRVTTLEYKKAVFAAESLGFEGFIQNRSSATLDMTPDFSE